jgi:hypothetical protein
MEEHGRFRGCSKELHLSLSEPAIEALYSQGRKCGHVAADTSLAFMLLLETQIYCSKDNHWDEISDFRYVTPYIVVDIYQQHLEGTCCLHLQGLRGGGRFFGKKMLNTYQTNGHNPQGITFHFRGGFFGRIYCFYL